MDDLISKLSEIRSEYNCFDEDEEPYYRALAEAIRILSQRADEDTISRQAALNALCTPHGILYPIRTVEELPSAQPEIIRCKDCKWFGDIGCAIRIVDDGDKPSETDFCSFAERIQDDRT